MARVLAWLVASGASRASVASGAADVAPALPVLVRDQVGRPRRLLVFPLPDVDPVAPQLARWFGGMGFPIAATVRVDTGAGFWAVADPEGRSLAAALDGAPNHERAHVVDRLAEMLARLEDSLLNDRPLPPTFEARLDAAAWADRLDALVVRDLPALRTEVLTERDQGRLAWGIADVVRRLARLAVGPTLGGGLLRAVRIVDQGPRQQMALLPIPAPCIGPRALDILSLLAAPELGLSDRERSQLVTRYRRERSERGLAPVLGEEGPTRLLTAVLALERGLAGCAEAAAELAAFLEYREVVPLLRRLAAEHAGEAPRGDFTGDSKGGTPDE